MKFLLPVVLLSLAVGCVIGVPPSRFSKKINVHKLDEEWKTEKETDDWHEDSLEWEEKKRPKAPQFDPSNPNAFVQQAMSKNSNNNSGMNMFFATLKKKLRRDETTELGGKWSALLKTNGVNVAAYAVEDDMILFTESNGRVLEARDFILGQSEVEKVTMNDIDYFEEDIGKSFVGGDRPKDAKESRRRGKIERQKQKNREKRKKEKRKRAAEAAMRKLEAKKKQSKKHKQEL